MKSDIELLKTPLKDLTPEELKKAFVLNEARFAAIACENEKYIPPALKSIQIITDAIEVKSMANGKMYTSRKKYYDHVKELGSHIVEKGELTLQPNRKVRGDFDCSKELKQAIHQHLR